MQSNGFMSRSLAKNKDGNAPSSSSSRLLSASSSHTIARPVATDGVEGSDPFARIGLASGADEDDVGHIGSGVAAQSDDFTQEADLAAATGNGDSEGDVPSCSTILQCGGCGRVLGDDLALEGTIPERNMICFSKVANVRADTAVRICTGRYDGCTGHALHCSGCDRLVGRVPRQGDSTFAPFVGMACFDGGEVQAYGAGSTEAVLDLVHGAKRGSSSSSSSSSGGGGDAPGQGAASSPVGLASRGLHVRLEAGLESAAGARAKLREQIGKLHEQVRQLVAVQAQLVEAAAGAANGGAPQGWQGQDALTGLRGMTQGAGLGGLGMQSVSAMPAVATRLTMPVLQGSPSLGRASGPLELRRGQGTQGSGGRGVKRRRVTPQAVPSGSPDARPQRVFAETTRSAKGSGGRVPMGSAGWEQGLLSRAAREAGVRAGALGVGGEDTRGAGRGSGVGAAAGGEVSGNSPARRGRAGAAGAGAGAVARSPVRKSPRGGKGRRSGSPSLMLLGMHGAGTGTSGTGQRRSPSSSPRKRGQAHAGSRQKGKAKRRAAAEDAEEEDDDDYVP